MIKFAKNQQKVPKNFMYFFKLTESLDKVIQKFTKVVNNLQQKLNKNLCKNLNENLCENFNENSCEKISKGNVRSHNF